MLLTKYKRGSRALNDDGDFKKFPGAVNEKCEILSKRFFLQIE